MCIVGETRFTSLHLASLLLLSCLVSLSCVPQPLFFAVLGGLSFKGEYKLLHKLIFLVPRIQTWVPYIPVKKIKSWLARNSILCLFFQSRSPTGNKSLVRALTCNVEDWIQAPSMNHETGGLDLASLTSQVNRTVRLWATLRPFSCLTGLSSLHRRNLSWTNLCQTGTHQQCVSRFTDCFFLWQYLFGQNTPNTAQLYVPPINLV